MLVLINNNNWVIHCNDNVNINSKLYGKSHSLIIIQYLGIKEFFLRIFFDLTCFHLGLVITVVVDMRF